MIQNIDTFLAEILKDFTPKQSKVLMGRFGLKSGAKATLQEIGDVLGITRERVRQIEEQAIKKARINILEDSKKIIDFAIEHLEGLGGVRKNDQFLSDMKHFMPAIAKTKNVDSKLAFIFMVAGNPLYAKEDETLHDFWYVNDAAKKKFLEFKDKLVNFFREKGKKEIMENKAHLLYCKDFDSCHLISISKEFGTNVFGDVGLKEWEEIDPRTIRDKIYLALKKSGKPLHFTEIATAINKFGIDKKKAHVQTVHNELIKDGRYVLVGRGQYALSENGFEAGTVREVITQLLKKHGPLKSEEVLAKVNKKRILKRNTILLNLQNKKFFKRLPDGRYSVV